jgi:hypothetical protein
MLAGAGMMMLVQAVAVLGAGIGFGLPGFMSVPTLLGIVLLAVLVVFAFVHPGIRQAPPVAPVTESTGEPLNVQPQP